jgi:hypothetical protein
MFVAPPNGTTSVVGYAVAQAPTFFSLWIGNNDVLGYATTGGDGSNPLLLQVQQAQDLMLHMMLCKRTYGGGAKGVIANIPYVNTVPFSFVANPVPLVRDKLLN